MGKGERILAKCNMNWYHKYLYNYHGYSRRPKEKRTTIGKETPMFSTQPYEDMSFDDFVLWATGYIIMELAMGHPLRSSVWAIMNNFTLNWLPTHGWKQKK